MLHFLTVGLSGITNKALLLILEGGGDVKTEGGLNVSKIPKDGKFHILLSHLSQVTFFAVS